MGPLALEDVQLGLVLFLGSDSRHFKVETCCLVIVTEAFVLLDMLLNVLQGQSNLSAHLHT